MARCKTFMGYIMTEIDSIIKHGQRKLLVSENDIALNSTSQHNKIFVLMVEESRGSAGGRAAGSGNRRIDRIYGFNCAGGKCKQFFETADQEMIDKFDIPYSAVAMDIIMSDGSQFVVQGVVDPQLVKSYLEISGKLE
jgi:hypothetical protein